MDTTATTMIGAIANTTAIIITITIITIIIIGTITAVTTITTATTVTTTIGKRVSGSGLAQTAELDAPAYDRGRLTGRG